MPRMAGFVLVREAETWTVTNIVGGLFLLALVAAVIAWAIKRYLNS